MYRCRECGHIFEELADIHKDGGCYEADYGVYFDFPDHHYYPSVDYKGCPNCEAFEDDIEEVVECDSCGEYYPQDDLYDTTGCINGGIGFICEQCWEDNDIKEIGG